MSVKIGLSPFSTYINGVGSDRIRIIREQRDRYTNPGSMAWWPYLNAFTALRAAISAADPEVAIAKMASAAPSRMGQHYDEIAIGIRRLLAKERFTLVPTRPALWSEGGLTVSVDHCLGLRRPDRSTLYAFPYFKAEPLAGSVAAGCVRIMETVRDHALPSATPCLLEVRSGRLHRLARTRDRDRLDCWLRAEASGYVAHWEAAA